MARQTIPPIPEKVEAIFFDIDGTLVSFNTHQIPESTRQALHRLRRQGIKVFIATGRPKMLIDNLDGLEFDGYITLNGSYCFTVEGEEIFKRPLPQEDIARLVDFIAETSIPFTFFDDRDHSFITSINDDVRKMIDMHGIAMPPVMPATEATTRNILQLNGFFSPEVAQQLQIAERVLTGCDLTRWSPLFADVIAKGNSKVRGIDAVCERYAIPLARTMAFGDGGNDIGMLRHVGLGIAMGNAGDDVKQAADYVTDDILNDGLANALDRFVFSKER